MSTQILANPGQWLTTADVAARLHLTPRWVRRLARIHDLPCEITPSGQHLFRRSDIHRVLLQRTEAAARSRPVTLAAVRVRMLKAGFEPRQLSLFGPRLKLVAPQVGERPDPQAEVKASRSFEKTAGSEKLDYVNRKAHAS